MSSLRARIALSAYRWAGVAAYPAVNAMMALRTARGKEERARKSERYGYASAARPEGPLVWIHAASVGETNAMVPLIKEIARRDITVLLTTGTVTSASVAHRRLGDEVIHQYVPLDLKPVINRFLEYWQPDIALFAESEIWPVTVMELGHRHIPQILVNARISDRSFRRWSSVTNIASTLFENFALVIAQSELDATRFQELGALPVLVSGNLKADSGMPEADQLSLTRCRYQIGERQTWAAISTFDGEEKAAAAVHRALKSRIDLLSIIVPRHPERADEIEAMLLEEGLNVARRSRNDAIAPDTDIYLGDTIGEMSLYLQLTEVAFVGRSLTAEGGQNPLEPAMMGCAILSGGHVGNFRESYQMLASNGSARMVRDGEMLTKGVYYLLTNEPARHRMIDAGLQTVHQMRGALNATLRGLEPYINPLTMKARLMPRNGAIAGA
ncbi:lipid IV(A) 3-deoxy-D-manno-octulosonic acid transferase [Rhizobium sp. KVB221]|uniref:3-deoxy-D-manno-octulosonic acid transferase n=1 Tax=Rhizobium setariae TaxID=2801340 RepID=A0A937CN06_9HYPH|nr:lipid IV(A) 3-deoxy-D-manno-octulosonic acid transferase [Rhizobium setariae]MBL0370598.1 lipid IV(A) 3-deoxy-D-manno-octulosonic acid transferase [Rhizobium setariae]